MEEDMGSLLQRRWLGPVAVAVIINHAYGAPAPRRCEQVLSGLGAKLVDAKCTVSTDLTTANP